MWKLFYMIYVLGKMKRNFPIQKKISKSPSSKNLSLENRMIFRYTLQKYIGQTITVFVIGGGYGGSGYTGILMNVKEEYISIFINPMTLAEIPISKIACFSHNVL